MTSLTIDGQSGLTPLFRVYQWFLNRILTPASIEHLLNDTRPSGYDVGSDWQLWFRHMASFMVVLCLGLAAAVVLLISCCWYASTGCGCSKNRRCCWWWSASVRDRDRERLAVSARTRCCVLSTAVIILMLAVTMCSFAVCSLVLNERIRDALLPQSASQHSLASDVTTATQRMQVRLVRHRHDAASVYERALNASVFASTELLQTAPGRLLQAVERRIGLQQALSELHNYTQSLPALATNLRTMRTTARVLADHTKQLNQQLRRSQTTIRQQLVECWRRDVICEDLYTKNLFLESFAEYDTVYDVTDALQQLDDVIYSGVLHDVNISLPAGHNVSQSIRYAIAAALGNTSEAVHALQRDANMLLVNFEAKLDSFSKLLNATKVIPNFLDDLYGFAPCIYALFALLTSIQLLIAFVYVTGVLLAISKLPSLGSKLLKFGQSILISCCWYFCLTATLLLAVGGMGETLVCRDDPPSHRHTVAIESLVSRQRNITMNISLVDMLYACSSNASLYRALHPHGDSADSWTVASISVYDGSDGNATNPLPLHDAALISPDTLVALLATQDLVTPVQFQSYSDQLRLPITAVDIPAFILQLQNMTADHNTTTARTLADEVADLERILNTTIARIGQYRHILHDAVTAARAHVTATNISLLTARTTRAQHNLSRVTSHMLREQTVAYVDDVIARSLDDISQAVNRDAGGCRDVYDAVTSIVQAPCAYLLYPLNALCVCYGCYTALGVAVMIMTSCVVNKLRPRGEESSRVHPLDVNADDDVFGRSLHTVYVKRQPGIRAVPTLNDRLGVSTLRGHHCLRSQTPHYGDVQISSQRKTPLGNYKSYLFGKII